MRTSPQAETVISKVAVSVASKNAFAIVVMPKNDNNSSPKDAEQTFDDTRNNCRCCLEPGHR